MNHNQQVIEQFYQAFQRKDYEAMQACYHEKIVFQDAAFGKLQGKRAKAMWHMLIDGSKDLDITYNNILADNKTGSAHWEARYKFSQTGQKVHNILDARFEFKDGKIIKHADNFDFYRWSRQALGLMGWVLGWTPFLQNKIQTTVNKRLDIFIAKTPQYQV